MTKKYINLNDVKRIQLHNHAVDLYTKNDDKKYTTYCNIDKLQETLNTLDYEA